MDARSIAAIFCFMFGLIVEPPEFAGFHPDFFLSGPQVIAGITSQNEVISIADPVIVPSINMRINAVSRFELHDFCSGKLAI